MKSLPLTMLVIVLFSVMPSATAIESSSKLSVSMELKEGETIVGTPRVIVVNGERATVELGSKFGAGNTDCAYPRGWWVDVTPMLEEPGQVSTKVTFKSFQVTADCVPSSRNMTMKIMQKLGEPILLQMPANNFDPLLALTIKTDVIAQ